jgi:hypothetical protein
MRSPPARGYGIRIVETKEYRMSQNHILETIGINKNWLTRLQFSLPHVNKTPMEQGLNHVTSVLILMKSANSVAELRRLVQRQYGIDQPNSLPTQKCAREGWGKGKGFKPFPPYPLPRFRHESELLIYLMAGI